MCVDSVENKEPILETGSGFFWGNTDYDEWYWNELQATADAIEVIIRHHEEGDTYE